jgi:hypothetical protein
MAVKEASSSNVALIVRGEPKLAHKVVLQSSKNIGKKELVITMDNFFMNIGLFKYISTQAIYATGTMRSNRVDISTPLKDTRH